MSDSIDETTQNKTPAETPAPEATPTEEPQLVSADYKTDMFKFKEQSKALAEELQALKNERAAERTDKLKADQEYKTLFEEEVARREKLEAETQSQKQQFVDSSKLNAVVTALGGFKKDSYIKFVDANNVQMTDGGTIDSESLKAEADRVRQEYPELLKAASTASLPNTAPKQVSTEKPISELTSAQLRALYTQSQKK